MFRGRTELHSQLASTLLIRISKITKDQMKHYDERIEPDDARASIAEKSDFTLKNMLKIIIFLCNKTPNYRQY